MTMFQSIILGIVQGVTEFLPISSSGHLAILPYLLGWELHSEDTFAFFVLVQVASLVGVFVYFWQDLVSILRAMFFGLFKGTLFSDPCSILGLHIIIATLPAGLAGILLKERVEEAFTNPAAVGAFLWITAGLLFIAERVGKKEIPLEKITWKDALWVGLFQVFSLFPGISRSGATIAGGMVRKLERPAAARFAFLLSVPVMMAAGLLEAINLATSSTIVEELPVYVVGFIASALTSYLAIRWLLGFLKKHPFYIFIGYCALLGTVIMIIT